MFDIDDPMLSQKFAFMFCEFDTAAGSRNWNEMQPSVMTEIVVDVAIKALQSGINERDTIAMIYFGSPQAQSSVKSFRESYARSIVEKAKQILEERTR